MPSVGRVLHLSFHRGCIADFAAVAEALDLDLSSWHVFSHPPGSFDGTTRDLNIYNMCAERAERIWRRHQDVFRSFDTIVTSDTAPLSRIFLQNGWGGALVIWVCNRFDYSHQHDMDCEFPDPGYYDLFREAAAASQVTIVPSTEYESEYAAGKGVDIGTRVIKPVGGTTALLPPSATASVAGHRDDDRTLFIHPGWHGREQASYLLERCRQVGIEARFGRYDATRDLRRYRGVLYIPLQALNFYLFESFHHGILNFVPSEAFIARERERPSPIGILPWCLPRQSEWYREENRECLVYFDTWEDLKEKFAAVNVPEARNRIARFARHHRTTMTERWREVFHCGA